MKEFQNEQHKQLHNALIGAGFVECNGENMPNGQVNWNYGYINQSLDEFIYFDYCKDRCLWVCKISKNESAAFNGAPIDDIITHYESLGQTQPITKDNIAEVLKFNNITDISVHTNSLGKKHCFNLSLKPDNWLDILEAIVGKLKPLPKLEEIVLKVGDKIKFMNTRPTVIKSFDYVNQKVNYECGFDEFNNLNKGHIESVNGKSGICKIPEFDFEQYLLDNGFKVEQGQHGIVLKFSYVSIYKSELLTGGNWDYQGSRIQPTPQNADILIAMANLAKDLK